MTDHSPASPRAAMSPEPLMLAGEAVPQRGHICAFFDSAEEKYAVLAPFFAEAITRGDRVQCVVSRDGLSGHLDKLREHRVPVDTARDADRFDARATEDTYLRGGRLSLDSVLDMVRDGIATAAREGRCLRTCGEMSWIGQEPEMARAAITYESKVNTLLTDDCTLICVYDTREVPAFMVADILATHEYALINGRLRRNPYFVPADEYIEMLNARHWPDDHVS